MNYNKNLSVPNGIIDVVLDTDAHAEVDDQCAIAYMLKSKEKLNTVALYAAPYSHAGSIPAAEAMELSYLEILKIEELMGESVPAFRGSKEYLPDEKTPVISPAALDLAERVNSYSEENPLYVVSIGAITNVASAILLNPDMAKKAVVVWLGGHARHYTKAEEYNLRQDVAAARVVFGSGIPLVQLPCMGVVSAFAISKPELVTWMNGKNKISEYLSETIIKYIDAHERSIATSKVIWDVCAVGWLLNDGDRFMESRIVPTLLPTYDGYYSEIAEDRAMRYVYNINRDALMSDFISKIISD